MNPAEARAFVDGLRLRPGYDAVLGGDLLLMVSCVGPDSREGVRPIGCTCLGPHPSRAQCPVLPRRWYWSMRLDWPDIDTERTLLAAVLTALAELDVHEHAEFLRIGDRQPIQPHRDHVEVAVTIPLELR